MGPVVAQYHIATLSTSKTEKLPLNPGVGTSEERPEGERGQKRRRSSSRLVETQLEERREPPPILPPIRSLPTRTRQQGPSLPDKNKPQNVRRAKSSKITTPITSAKDKPSTASRPQSTPHSEVQVVIFVNSRNEQQLLHKPDRTEGWSPKRLRSSKTGASGGSIRLPSTQNRDATTSVDDDIASHITVSADSNDTRDEGQEYDVERIVGEKIAPRVHEFLIEWVGYAKLDWIPAEDCFCLDKISEFRATQCADLIEATEAGQNAEAEKLRGLADAERLRSQNLVVAMPKRPMISSPKQMRDQKTGRFLTLKVRGIEVPEARGNQHDPDVDGQNELEAEEEEVPRNARANTARLTSKAPTLANRNDVLDDTTGGIVWVQSQVSGQNRLSPQNLMGLGRTTSRDNVESWIAKNTALEEAEIRRRMADDLVEELRKQQERVAEDQRILAALNLKKQEIEARDRQRKAMEGEQMEREELGRRKVENEATQQRESIQIREQMESRARSATIIRDEILEAQRMRERMWKQKPEHAFANISATKQDVSLRPSYLPISSIDAIDDPSPATQNENAQQLRAAREQEARTHQAGAIPSLVRSEFRTALSHRQAEALINQTRASPERSFGVSIPDNTLRETIET